MIDSAAAELGRKLAARAVFYAGRGDLPDRSWIRFSEARLWGRPYTVDGERRYRCETCDAILERRGYRCSVHR